MADKKISALTGASTALAGTEVLPIVQAGATVKVSVANLTAGRAVSAASIAATGNIVSDTLFRVTNAGQIEQNGGTGGLYFLNTAVGAAATNMRFLTTNALGAAQLQLQLAGGATPTNSLYGDSTLETGNLIIATAGKGIDFSATAGTGTSELLADYEEGNWTPVVTAGTGSITTYTSSGKYTKTGRQVTATFIITVIDNGTGASYLIVTGQPFTQLTNVALYGYNQSTGISIGGQLSSGTMNLYSSSVTYPIATGQAINCTVIYFV
jgi:hypothetical protein